MVKLVFTNKFVSFIEEFVDFRSIFGYISYPILMLFRLVCGKN